MQVVVEITNGWSRKLSAGLVIAVLLAGVAPSAWAGSPHFISVSVVRSDTSLTAIGKEAGLGNETQVEIEVAALAECINPGSNKPQAGNKESVSAQGTFPVQNGKADFSLTLSPDFQPDCSPPMTVIFSDVTVCDVSHDLCRSFAGTF